MLNILQIQRNRLSTATCLYLSDMLLSLGPKFFLAKSEQEIRVQILLVTFIYISPKNSNNSDMFLISFQKITTF